MSVDEDRLDRRPEDALVGTLFAGCYEILSVLGQGGMSVVYKALYVPLNQLVAVKVMHTHVDDGNALQRLKREAQLIATLDHPNILRVLRLNVSDHGYPYLVADLVEGRTIQKVVQEEGPFDERTFMHVFTQVLDALEHAHSRSIVHRDIKPSNLMLTRDEDGDGELKVKVVDFGISKLLTDSAGGAQDVSRATSSFFGTPAYMSPEQCAGRSADYRSDIYSLACVMYETLTAVPAVTGETALDIMYHQVHDTPRPFRDVKPDINLPPHIEQAIFTALRKNRNDRPQSIHEFRTMLNGKIPIERAIYHGRVRRLSKWAVIVCAVVFLMMAIVLGGSLSMLSNQASAPKDSVDPAQPVVFDLPSTAEECFQEGARANATQDTDAVVRYLQRADELVKTEKHTKLSPEHHFELKMMLAIQFKVRKDFVTALKYYREAEPFLKYAGNTGSGWYWRERSEVAGSTKDNQKAIEYAKKSVAAYEKAFRAGAFEREHTDLGGAYDTLATAYQKSGMIKESDDAHRKAVAAVDPLVWAAPKLEMRRRWADQLLLQKRFAEAKKVMDKYMEIAKSSPASEVNSENELMLGFGTYGHLMAQSGSPQAARPFFAKAVELARLRPKAGSPMWNAFVGEFLSFQSINLYECGQIAEADEAGKECKELWPKSNAENVTVGLAGLDNARAKALARAASPQQLKSK